MKQERIEKAADNYSFEIMPAYSDGYFERYQLADAFEYGAQWRINSVWHNIDNELPECGQHVVNEDWFDFIAKDEKDLQRIIKKYPFKLWVYVSDLLPNCVKHDEK